jgi:hypothetical protein
MKHVTYEVEQDDTPQNPRDEYDNLSTFYGPKNSRYVVGGKTDREVYELDEVIKEFKKEGAVIVEFESNAGTCYAVVERDQLEDEYIKHGYTMRKALYWARHCAQGEIKTWLDYCNGEVYGYIVKDNDGEVLDSVWGFYGREYCEEEARQSAQWHENDIENRLQEERKELERRMALATWSDE